MSVPAGLTFPCDYPLKVLGRPGGDWRERVHAIVLRHAADTDAGQVRERLSSSGNYLSVSYTLNAQSREQVEALVTELRACEGVLMLL
ncbi:MAG TPA: DUF493 domain-containing protein [Steroidobacteraceae bacterium]|nr:DUF493 domain-containing protein [Steroidobacteraceae bacterium]